MDKEDHFSFRKRIKSFAYAWKGLGILFRREHNARIHLVFTMGVIIAGILFHISPAEWCAILICIGAVISAEAFNSSIEALADKITENQDPLIGKAKDLGAAAVLFLAIISIGVACFIFIPKF